MVLPLQSCRISLVLMAVPVIQGKVFMRLFALFLVQNHLQYENGGDNKYGDIEFEQNNKRILHFRRNSIFVF